MSVTVKRSRAQLAAEVACLSARGLYAREIAEELGISRSYADELRGDPTGARAAARKESYRKPCPKCGALMTGCNGLTAPPKQCASCAAAEIHDDRLWTRESIIAAFREFHRLAGRAPSTVDAQLQHPNVVPGRDSRWPTTEERIAEARELLALVRLPIPGVVQREFGSWREAVEAAGLQPVPWGIRARRTPFPTPCRDLLVARLADGESYSVPLARETGYTVRMVRRTLAKLEAAGVAESRLDGTRRLYRIRAAA